MKNNRIAESIHKGSLPSDRVCIEMNNFEIKSGLLCVFFFVVVQGSALSCGKVSE